MALKMAQKWQFFIFLVYIACNMSNYMFLRVLFSFLDIKMGSEHPVTSVLQYMHIIACIYG